MSLGSMWRVGYRQTYTNIECKPTSDYTMRETLVGIALEKFISFLKQLEEFLKVKRAGWFHPFKLNLGSVFTMEKNREARR